MFSKVMYIKKGCYACQWLFIYLYNKCRRMLTCCSLVATCWEMADLLALLYVMFSSCCFCHLPIWCPGSGVVFDFYFFVMVITGLTIIFRDGNVFVFFDFVLVTRIHQHMNHFLLDPMTPKYHILI